MTFTIVPDPLPDPCVFGHPGSVVRGTDPIIRIRTVPKCHGNPSMIFHYLLPDLFLVGYVEFNSNLVL
jgi:hypothetical protein